MFNPVSSVYERHIRHTAEETVTTCNVRLVTIIMYMERHTGTHSTHTGSIRGSWSYRVTSSAPMADGLSVWLVRRSGIPCRTACGIRLVARTVSDNL